MLIYILHPQTFKYLKMSWLQQFLCMSHYQKHKWMLIMEEVVVWLYPQYEHLLWKQPQCSFAQILSLRFLWYIANIYST